MSTTANSIIKYYKDIDKDWKLPSAYSLIYPFDNKETWRVFKKFYKNYFSDNNQRVLLFGINPGRFGAGVTGIPFTDPKLLEDICGIDSEFQKRHELSAIFIYKMIEAFGGVEAFYSKFLISSICPLGFLKDRINYNYYDAKDLTAAVEPYILSHIKAHLNMNMSTNKALCIGMGKNYKYFKNMNAKHGFFKEIIPLPHPRWVMQYRRKHIDENINKYMNELFNASA